MRRSIFTLITFALLLNLFASCTDHRSSGVTPTGRRFQLRSLSTDNYGLYKNYSRGFSYSSAGLLQEITTRYSDSFSSLRSYFQLQVYNSSNQLTGYTYLSTTTGNVGPGIRRQYTYGRDNRVIEIKTYNVILYNNAVPNAERLAQIDSLRYDDQGRVSRVDGNYYIIGSDVSGPQTDSKATTTIDYDGKGNPIRATFIQSPHPGSQQWTRTRTVYEYDNHINPLAPISLADSPFNFNPQGIIPNMMKNNPVRIKAYSLGEDLVERGLLTETNFSYEYQDDLPVKMIQSPSQGLLAAPSPQPDQIYTFSYNFL